MATPALLTRTRDSVYSGASISAFVDNVPYPIAKFEYKTSVDRKEVRDHGQELAGRTKGIITRSGSMTMRKEWADQLRLALSAKAVTQGLTGGWVNVSFDIMVKFEEAFQASVIMAIGIFIKEDAEDFDTSSTDAVMPKFDLDINQILYNGKSASGQKLFDSITL